MLRSSEVELKVGMFVSLGIGLILFLILFVGGSKSFFQSASKFHTKFSQVEGLIEGAVVKVAGVKVGQVEKIKFLKETGQVDVWFSVNSKYLDAVHKDSVVGVQTQGMLGDRFLVVGVGSLNAELANSGDELPGEPAKELKDYLHSADDILERARKSLSHLENILSSFNKEGRPDIFFKNISGLSANLNGATQHLPGKMKDFYGSLEHFNSILAKIDAGHGTVGALINDSSLFDDMKALLGGANRNRILKYFIKRSVENSREAAEEEVELNRAGLLKK